MVGLSAPTSSAAISGAASGHRPRASSASPNDEPSAQSRALVAVTPVARVDAPPPVARRVTSSAFLAHLIATREQMPQTRERRRAEPADAVSTYAAASAATPMPAGAVMARAI